MSEGSRGAILSSLLPAAAILVAAALNLKLPDGMSALIATAGALISGAATVTALLRAHWEPGRRTADPQHAGRAKVARNVPKSSALFLTDRPEDSSWPVPTLRIRTNGCCRLDSRSASITPSSSPHLCRSVWPHCSSSLKKLLTARVKQPEALPSSAHARRSENLVDPTYRHIGPAAPPAAGDGVLRGYRGTAARACLRDR